MKSKTKKPRTETAIRYKVVVVDDYGAVVGGGYIYYGASGLRAPDLVDLHGNALPAGQYNIHHTDESNLVVLAKGIH